MAGANCIKLLGLVGTFALGCAASPSKRDRDDDADAGGGCKEAPCVVAQDQACPHSLALDGNALFWTNQGDGTVLRAGKGGGAPETLVASVDPRDLALDATSVYFASKAPAAVFKVPKSGGSATKIADNQQGPEEIALDADHVYYTDRPKAVGEPTRIFRVPLAGGAPEERATAESTGIDVDADNLYLSRGNQVDELPKAGGDFVVLAQDQAWARGVVVDPNGIAKIYWVDRTSGTVLKFSLGGGGISTVAAGQNRPQAVAVDAGGVYWVNEGSVTEPSGEVVFVPLSGGAPTVLAGAQARPQAIAVDTTGIYWINRGMDPDCAGGGVLRLEK